MMVQGLLEKAKADPYGMTTRKATTTATATATAKATQTATAKND